MIKFDTSRIQRGGVLTSTPR